MDQFRNKSGYICDMDGVIYHGNRLLPGAKEFVEWLYREKKKFLFLTNNSGKTPRELQDKLARMGLEVDEQHFYTSALATAEFIAAQMPGAKAYVIGEPGLYNALYDRGITLSDINPDYVVMGESPNYNYDAICKAVHLVQKGARFIGCNSDLTGPTEEGLVPSCRALVAPIEMGHRPAGLLHRKAQPPDDAHRPEAAGGPLPGRRHHRRPDGHRHCGRHRERPGHPAGPLRRHHPGGDGALPLPAPPDPQRGGRDPARSGITRFL